MLIQHEALDILEGSGVVSVSATGDDDHLHSFIITTTEGERIAVCVFGNYLHVECYDPSEIKGMEW